MDTKKKESLFFFNESFVDVFFHHRHCVLCCFLVYIVDGLLSVEIYHFFYYRGNIIINCIRAYVRPASGLRSSEFAAEITTINEVTMSMEPIQCCNTTYLPSSNYFEWKYWKKKPWTLSYCPMAGELGHVLLESPLNLVEGCWYKMISWRLMNMLHSFCVTKC